MTLIGILVVILIVTLVLVLLNILLGQIPQVAPWRGLILLVVGLLLLILFLTGDLSLGIG